MQTLFKKKDQKMIRFSYLYVRLLAEVYDNSPTEVSIVLFNLSQQSRAVSVYVQVSPDGGGGGGDVPSRAVRAARRAGSIWVCG